MSGKVRNSVFAFKQFSINDAKCAMKVGTDGVLLGLFAGFIAPLDGQSVLDVGVGSGVVSMILAQALLEKHTSPQPLAVTGVDIDAAACAQAVTNFAAAGWPVTFTPIVGDVCNVTGAFDCIVANPPFYRPLPGWREKQGEEATLRDRARQLDSLLPQRLVEVIQRCLAPTFDGGGGGACVIYPSNVINEFLSCLGGASDLVISHRLDVCDAPETPPIRTLLRITRTSSPATPCEPVLLNLALHVSKTDRRYTDEYKAFAQHVYPYLK